MVETGSETDEDDRLAISEDYGLANGRGGGEDEEAGSPAASPLLSYRDQEGSEGWRRREGHLNGNGGFPQHTTAPAASEKAHLLFRGCLMCPPVDCVTYSIFELLSYPQWHV